MALGVEQKEQESGANKPIEAIPETPTIPDRLEKGGVTATPSQFTAQVVDDKGAALLQTPETGVTITLPDDPAHLAELSKGSITSAVTWFGAHWIRMMKKAWAASVKVLVKPKK